MGGCGFHCLPFFRIELWMEFFMEKYRELVSGSTVVIALIAALGGCVVNYLSEFKQTGRMNFRWMIPDLVISGFVGFFVFWFFIEHGFSASEGAVATCIAGNLGSRIFDIFRFLIEYKIGLPKSFLTHSTEKKKQLKSTTPD